MSAWVRATVDNRDEIVYLNLDLAVRMERPQNRNYTAIQFLSGAGSQPAVKETPEELFAQKQRQEAERHLCENPTDKRLDDINKILTWSSDMHRRGHMPDDVVRAFHEHFGEAYQA